MKQVRIFRVAIELNYTDPCGIRQICAARRKHGQVGLDPNAYTQIQVAKLFKVNGHHVCHELSHLTLHDLSYVSTQINLMQLLVKLSLLICEM
jgi:hypothetical protein